MALDGDVVRRVVMDSRRRHDLPEGTTVTDARRVKRLVCRCALNKLCLIDSDGDGADDTLTYSQEPFGSILISGDGIGDNADPDDRQ